MSFFKNRRPLEITVTAVCLCTIFYCLFHLNTSSLWRMRGEQPTSFIVAAYQAQVASRRDYLEKIKKADNNLGYGYLFNNLAPEVYCPEKIKVGTTDDGGKWMCAPERLPANCVILALGINGAITFEEDLQRMAEQRCRIISVDMNQQTENVAKALARISGSVVKAKIAGQDNPAKNLRTLASILREQKAEDVEILKIDIEGAEFAVMKPFLEEYTPAQIMIEIHGTPLQNLQLLQMFSSKGYLLFNYEINGRARTLCEYAFIHQSRLETYGATLLAKYL